MGEKQLADRKMKPWNGVFSGKKPLFPKAIAKSFLISRLSQIAPV